MTIRRAEKGDRCTLFLEGRLDTSTSPQLKEEVENCPEDIKRLTLDFEKVAYVSSAGLRVLLFAHKRISAGNGRMTVRGLGEEVREVFAITGFLDILNVED